MSLRVRVKPRGSAQARAKAIGHLIFAFACSAIKGRDLERGHLHYARILAEILVNPFITDFRVVFKELSGAAGSGLLLMNFHEFWQPECSYVVCHFAEEGRTMEEFVDITIMTDVQSIKSGT